MSGKEKFKHVAGKEKVFPWKKASMTEPRVEPTEKEWDLAWTYVPGISMRLLKSRNRLAIHFAELRAEKDKAVNEALEKVAFYLDDIASVEGQEERVKIVATAWAARIRAFKLKEG